MTSEQAVAFYKTQRKIGTTLRLSPGRVSQMVKEGGFKYPLQCVLEKHSQGYLEAKYDDEPKAA